MKKINILIVFLGILFLNCNLQESSPTIKKTSLLEIDKIEAIPSISTPFPRDIKRLKKKIQDNIPLVIHVRVPLCDNDNQGIAPVSKKQGDGFNLTTNLYWGAKYGVKNYFKKYSTWKFIKSEKDISPEILERIIFSKTFSNSAKVYLIADAYRGDKMKACLTDFFSSISGKNLDSININEQQIGINSNADLIVFNGHNGLMDTDVPFYKSQDNIIRHVGVIACASHGYFEEYLLKSKGYPVIMTQQLLAPEAYNLEAIFDAWVNLHDGNYIVQQSGKAYHKYQKCGIKGATQIFRTGW